MEIKLVGATEGYRDLLKMKRFSQDCARGCYSEKDWDEIVKEPYNEGLINRTIDSGHHSVYDHVTFNFWMSGIPKALAMFLNNEQDYVTSEKSARFTEMKPTQEQKEKYDKWMRILLPMIDEVYPPMDDTEQRKKNLKKLGQENARYMTSVFTPTKMVHTMSFGQLNHVAGYFEEFLQGNLDNEFDRRFSPYIEEFLDKIKTWRVPDLINQTDRHLSFYGEPVEEHFGDAYSTNYQMSLAALAQAHRHRTIEYHVTSQINVAEKERFFVPQLLREDNKLRGEWLNDLRSVAKSDFPQAQLVDIAELGTLRNFRSKLILRLCGHAQNEIMEKTYEIAKMYNDSFMNFQAEWLYPKCMQKMKCNEQCIWTGKNAMTRIV
jgi:thymidylate synthase ThyX